jgi:NAD(P)-dependent dehydrogenase (short-subunit alcohol dehydrogenase family)
MTFNINDLFDLSGQVAVVTGGGGVLCRALCLALGQLQVKVVVLDLTAEHAQRVADEITAQGGEALAVRGDVLDVASLEAARETILARFGRMDILVNGAGGNKPQANTSAQQTFFDLSPDALRWVVDLNLMGTILPSQVFGKTMAAQKTGVILNFSSMAAYRPLTRVLAYAAAKAGVTNFTQWLAVHMAQEYGPQIRVNAVAPGFFVGAQNRSLLLREDGSLTPRGQNIIAHTPMGRFGVPDDLLGTMLWLLSPASAFITGIVVPVDGGFSAFGGV